MGEWFELLSFRVIRNKPSIDRNSEHDKVRDHEDR